MLAVGRGIEPAIDWREGNAMELPLEDASVDVALCHQGFQFFPDKLQAAREMRRVLVPGGRLVVAAWRPLEEAPVFREVDAMAERHVGVIADNRFGFGDAAALEGVLRAAGFRDVASETVTLPVRFDDATMFFQMNAMACVGMSARAKNLSDDERRQVAALIAQESVEATRSYAAGGGLAFDAATNIATARA
jgi:SAM-dependent methyltransferase